jgi:hypothetical protein
MRMTEAGWLSCDDPRLMLDFLRGKVSRRKFRWFACACVRQVWHALIDERSVHAVEVAERHADGEASDEDLLHAEAEALEVARQADLRTTVSDSGWAATRAATRAASADAEAAASGAAFIATLSVAPWRFDGRGISHHGDPTAKAAARRAQCMLVREVFGNPFRIDWLMPGWVEWNDGTVPRLARTIYADRRFEEMPVLGDALEEAGCADAEVLEHCRSSVGHVRGCWLLDALLGRS